MGLGEAWRLLDAEGKGVPMCSIKIPGSCACWVESIEEEVISVALQKGTRDTYSRVVFMVGKWVRLIAMRGQKSPSRCNCAVVGCIAVWRW